MTMFHDVGDFHDKFGLPVTLGSRKCAFPDDATLAYRLRFLQEELNEYEQAVREGDLAGAVDALADLAWVALGTAHFFGAPFDAVWREVYRANMSKVLAVEGAPVHKRGVVEKIRKPVGWLPPDIQLMIDNHNRLANDANQRPRMLSKMSDAEFSELMKPTMPQIEGEIE
jgi:predicted HAD superfamily Cof-like phosphohydrolase